MRKINVIGKAARKISPQEFAKAMDAEMICEKKNMDVIDLMSMDFTKLNPKTNVEPRREEKDLEPSSKKTLFVLNNYALHNHLIGIFSTEAKAKQAADWHMQYFKPDKQITIEEANGETLYSVNEGRYVINITKWVVNSAILPDGKWGEA